MKKLILIFALLFSTSSFAEWTYVTKTAVGDNFYVDIERIRKNGEFVYFWSMVDSLKPTKYGDLSAKIYHQAECKLFRYKNLSVHFYKEPMGGGTSDTITPPEEWVYPMPGSAEENLLINACNH